jgi:hypothetical protein
MDIYSRLFKYRETPSISPLENFLTEALADIFNRLPVAGQVEFLTRMLPDACWVRLRGKCTNAKRINAETQVPIVVSNSVKRPDIVVELDGKPLVLFEVKVDAAFQEHESRSSEPKDSGEVETVSQNQLKTYSNWMRDQCEGDWSGAVVLLTHGTRAPEGFENGGQDNSVIGTTRSGRTSADGSQAPST